MPSRYIRHNHTPPEDLESVGHDILDALVTNIQLVRKRTLARQAQLGGGVYVGIAGTAVMYYHLSDLGLKELPPLPLVSDGDNFLALASSVPISLLSPRKCSFLETYVGVATLTLRRALQNSRVQPSAHTPATGNWFLASKILAEVTNGIAREDSLMQGSSPLGSEDCEALYGRAGFLYALLRLRSAFASTAGQPSEIATAIGSVVSDASLKVVINSIIMRGQMGAQSYSAETADGTGPALMWSWHGKRYLGSAHGVAGILHVLLLCPSHLIAPHMTYILHTAEWLLDLQDSAGNWPSSAPSRRREREPVQENELVHWCHGAPGIVILLSNLLRRAPSINGSTRLSSRLHRKITIALESGATLIYTHGFLRKGVGLCHGVAGSVFALLATFDALPSNGLHLQQAIHLAHLSTNYLAMTEGGEMRKPDRRWSLYEGTAGMCCAWGEILRRLETQSAQEIGCGMPGFDDIRVVE